MGGAAVLRITTPFWPLTKVKETENTALSCLCCYEITLVLQHFFVLHSLFVAVKNLVVCTLHSSSMAAKDFIMCTLHSFSTATKDVFRYMLYSSSSAAKDFIMCMLHSFSIALHIELHMCAGELGFLGMRGFL